MISLIGGHALLVYNLNNLFMKNNKTLEERIEELESLVYESKNVLSFEEASKFLNLSKSYLYKLTSAGLIPHYKPQGKMIYFEKNVLEEWLRQNPVKTQAQISQEANNYILTHKVNGKNG